MKKSFVFFFCTLFILVLSACSLPAAFGNSTYPNPTNVYNTVAAQLTSTPDKPVQNPSLVPTSGPIPSQSPNPSPSPNSTPNPNPSLTASSVSSVQSASPTLAPTKTSQPCDLAAPGRPSVDITIPDGARFEPGQSFSKTWRLVNAGTCTWTSDYAIVWFSGENFSAVREQAFGSTVQPGQSIDITVDMTAPRQPGAHQSNWKLRDVRGILFGIGPAGDAPFWVKIEVVDVATATLSPLPTITLTPTLAIAAKGNLAVESGKPVNLDSGKVNTGNGDDLLLQKVGTTYQLAPINSTLLADVGLLTPTDQDCLNAPLNAAPLADANLKEGETVCYKTSQGLPGFFRIKTASLKEGKFTIDYLTWALP